MTPDTILDKTFIYTNQTWTEGPLLNFRRRDHACGVININGHNHIMVSGGFINDESKGSTTIETLAMKNLKTCLQCRQNSEFQSIIHKKFLAKNGLFIAAIIHCASFFAVKYDEGVFCWL